VREFISTVTVQKIYNEQQPDLTDEWVRGTFPKYRSVAEWKDALAHAVYAEQQRIIDEDLTYQAVSSLVRRVEGTLPDELYEAKFSEFYRMYEEQASREGKTLKGYLDQQKIDIGQFKMDIMMSIRGQLKQALALDAYALHHNLQPSDQDYHDFYTEIDPENPQRVAFDLEANGRTYLTHEGALRIAAQRHLRTNG